MDTRGRIKKLSEERAAIMADLESCNNDLRAAIRKAVADGEITEMGAHKLTGVSRSTIRVWLGKA